MTSTARFHVEIARKARSKLKKADLVQLIKTTLEPLADPCTFNLELDCYSDLKEHVDSLRICEEKICSSLKLKSNSGNAVNGHSPGESNGNIHEGGDVINNFSYHCFELSDDLDEAEFIDGEEEEGQAAASHHWVLPARTFDGVWESLIFDADIKCRLMEYVKTALLFSEKGVNSSLIAWNKVILLHGPPGTGKTSLCRGLAQKASIRLGNKFSYGQLVEINSHSLFSKWFSESGKLVMKMFEKIHELIEDSDCIVFLLIDEVESLAQCRMSAEAGNEPSDSIRAVNALLTQIDRIKRYPNVVILTTSNIVGSIDLAFVDRADLKIYIGQPPKEIIYEIFASSINELIRVGIISDSTQKYLPEKVPPFERSSPNVHKLQNIATNSHGLSGRSLRKIPFLTHVNFIRSQACNLETFLNAMEQCIEIEKNETENLCNKKVPPTN